MKKNYLKISEHVRHRLTTIASNDVVVAASRSISEQELSRGALAHLGVRMEDGRVVVPEGEMLPAEGRGRYSRRNRLGWEVVLRDEPKVLKTFYLGERPIWGDYSKGTFSLHQTRSVFQREYHAPRELSLSLELIETKTDNGINLYTLKCQVNEVLTKTAPNFDALLLFDLNLLLENFGEADVFSSTATAEDYKRTLYVRWEFLPPGQGEENIRRIAGRHRNPDPLILARIKDRYEFIESLRPVQWVNGSSGFRRYFGAMFAANLIVLENTEYGNAVYVMFEDWQELSKLSRLELLARPDANFIRVKHHQNWKTG
ncbi:MAG: hypothetical protein IPM12_14950 [Flavobacteriales bacterium]|nr:hypothetical protein [Flavobacteriales bacterium]